MDHGNPQLRNILNKFAEGEFSEPGRSAKGNTPLAVKGGGKSQPNARTIKDRVPFQMD